MHTSLFITFLANSNWHGTTLEDYQPAQSYICTGLWLTFYRVLVFLEESGGLGYWRTGSQFYSGLRGGLLGFSVSNNDDGG